jgi:tetratricopeptide (TPR) repeat protein
MIKFLIAFSIVCLLFNYSCNNENITRSNLNSQNDLAMEYYKKGRDFFLKFTLNDVITAISYFEKALKIKSDFVLAFAAYSEALSYFGFQRERNGIKSDEIFARAKSSALKAISLDSNLYQSHRSLSWYYFALGLYTKAQLQALKALTIKNNDSETRFLLWASTESNSLDSTHLKNAIQSDYILALINAGSLARRQKKYDEALIYFEKVIKLVPDHAHAYVNIGNVYLYKNEPEKALKFYKKAQAIYNNDSYIHFNHAAAYIVLKEYKKAEEYYKNAINLNKSFFEAHQMLMRLYKIPLKNAVLYNFHKEQSEKIKKERQERLMHLIKLES